MQELFVGVCEVAIVESPPASPSEWLIRWVGRLGTETLATEGSVARAAEDAGRVIFCLLPLAGDPDLVEHDPDLAGLVEAHTHILVGQAHGRTWLGRARDARALAGGQGLVRLMRFRYESPSHLVDLRNLGLSGIDELGGRLRIGAT